MNFDTIQKIAQRDNYICQKCGKKIPYLADHYDPSKIVNEILSEMNNIKIYKWNQICWKCGNNTPIITYNFIDGFFNRHIGSTEKLDKILMKKYPFVKIKHSKTLQKDVIANACIHCDALQGNYYVGESIFEMEVNEIDMDEMIDITIPNTLQIDDLGFDDRNDSFQGWVCFKNCEIDNTDDNNLFLLCGSCRRKYNIIPMKYDRYLEEEQN